MLTKYRGTTQREVCRASLGYRLAALHAPQRPGARAWISAR